MATHSSVLAWRIPGTGKPDGLPSMGSHRVGHDWSDLAAAAAAAVWSRASYLTSLWQVPSSMCTVFRTVPDRWWALCKCLSFYYMPWNTPGSSGKQKPVSRKLCWFVSVKGGVQSELLHLVYCLNSAPCSLRERVWVYREVQFSSVAQSCPTLCDPMNRSTPCLPVHHQLPEFTQTCIHRVHDAIQPSHPLSSPSSPAPNPSQHQRLFQWVNSSHEVAKVLEFQL